MLSPHSSEPPPRQDECASAECLSPAIVADLRGEIRSLLAQPCQSCDASGQLAVLVNRMQEELRSQGELIRGLERAVADLRQVHQVGLEAPLQALAPAALAEAAARIPPAVVEPARADRLPSAKSAQDASTPLPIGSTTAASFPRSQNPALISEIAVLTAAGNAPLAWLVERLHADALLQPLAHAATEVATWRGLGETLAYGKQEIQVRIRDGLITDPAVRWIVVRMLARGRYVRFCDVRRAGGWDILRASLQRACTLPSWWFPPWSGHTAEVAASRSRRPLLPNEWGRSTKRVRCNSLRRPASSTSQPLPRPRSRPRSAATLKALWAPSPAVTTVPVAEACPSAPPVADVELDRCVPVDSVAEAPPAKSAPAKKRRRPKVKTDLKGGAAGRSSAVPSSGSPSSAFRVIAANVTSLFSRAAAVCAIGFGLAFLAETALTAQGQEILTMQLQREGRCVVWGAPVDGAGVTSSRGVALLGGPGVRVEPIGVPAELNEQWRDGRIVAGKARVGDDAQFNEVTCVACYADVYDASARDTLFERLLSWLVNIKGHVILGGDFNADLDDSPALFSLLDRGYHTANVGHDITCCAHGSSKGSVVDHLMLSPSLRPAFCHGGVLSEAPFPTHRPVVADFVGRLVEDICGSPVHFLSWGVPPLLMLTYGISRSGLTSSLSLLRDARWMLMRHGLLLLRRTLYSPADARVNRSLLATGGVEANQNSALAHLFAWLGVPCGVMRMPDGWSELDLALRSFAINGSSVISRAHMSAFGRMPAVASCLLSPPLTSPVLSLLGSRSNRCWIGSGPRLIVGMAKSGTRLCHSGVLLLSVRKRLVSDGPRLSMSSGRMYLIVLPVLPRLKGCGSRYFAGIAGQILGMSLWGLRVPLPRRWICGRLRSWTCCL